jgi:hypothetical protein
MMGARVLDVMASFEPQVVCAGYQSLFTWSFVEKKKP